MAAKPLKLIRASWGCFSGSGGKMCINKFLKSTKKEGYVGIEMPLSVALDYGKQDLIQKLQDNELGIIFQIFTDGPMAPGDNHWGNKFRHFHPEPAFTSSQSALVLQKQVEDALDFNPIKINSHSMRDFFSFQQAYEFFNIVIPFQNQITNIPVMHETHRKRFFHSPWVCRDFVIGNYGEMNFYDDDGLKMVSDFSHFTTVAECDTNDPHLNQVIQQLTPKMWHVHGRVGYDHGPQVNDPRAPEWKSYTEGFEAWWDDIFDKQMKNDSIKDITFTPEHGPANYQQTLPYTQQPIADIWEVNSFIGARALDRFEKKYGKQSLAK